MYLCSFAMLASVHLNEEMPENVSAVLALSVTTNTIIHSETELAYSVFSFLGQTSSQLVWLNIIER
jgi:hypothetical protein